MRVNFYCFFGVGFFLVQLSESQVPQPGTGPVPLTVTVWSPNTGLPGNSKESKSQGKTNSL